MGRPIDSGWNGRASIAQHRGKMKGGQRLEIRFVWTMIISVGNVWFPNRPSLPFPRKQELLGKDCSRQARNFSEAINR
jgi:hypothetical protein